MTENFITIDDDAISVKQAVAYLNATGDLPKFVQRILHRHVIESTLKERGDLAADAQQVEQAIVNFRVQNKLTDSGSFEQWLKSQGMNYETFRNRAEDSLRVELLKQAEIGDRARAYFNENKDNFDRVVLSRIVVLAKALADDLRKQIEAGSATFEALAKQNSITNDSATNGLMGTLQMGQLPPEIRDQLKGCEPGSLIGPLEVDGRYTLLRVEQYFPASYEGDLRKQLEDRFFGQWLQEQLQGKQIKLNLE